MPFFHRKPLSRCIALSALLSASGAMLLAPAALAVGLGEVALQSPLGKPLEARIPLTHLGDLTSDQIKVTLGSDEDYARLGVDRDYLHSQIRMQPVIEGGNAYLHITTSQPVVEPYINFVISLRWPNGQLAREYTMLLDVPTVATPAPTSAAATAAAPIGNISAAAAAADTAPQPSSAQTYASQTYAATPARAAPAMPLDGRYRTAPGDSLWTLAQRLRPAGVSTEQMMAALYAANPDAFVGGDPARMMAAVELKVPEASEATAAAPLPSSTPAPAAAEAAPSEAADRFAGTRAADTPATEPAAADTEPAATGGPRLELLAPTDIEQLTVENAALREEVKSLTSSVGTLTTQLDRSEQRLEQMEAQMQQVLAGYDRQRGVDGAAAAGSTSPFADGSGQAVASEPTDSDGVAAAQPVPEREGSLWMHLSYWIALGAVGGWALYQHSRKRREEEVEETFEPVVVAAPTPAPVVKPAPARVVSRDSMADVRRDIFSAEPVKTAPAKPASLPPEAAADAAGEWGSAEDNERYWHHHKDDVEELPLDLLDAEPVQTQAPSPFASAGGGSAGVEDSVDASISAGVFLAFGRYSEAEQVLLEALQRDPSRQDLRLQLLDVYQQGDMREAFEQLAKTIETECADEPEIIAEVAALRDSYSGRF